MKKTTNFIIKVMFAFVIMFTAFQLNTKEIAATVDTTFYDEVSLIDTTSCALTANLKFYVLSEDSSTHISLLSKLEVAHTPSKTLYETGQTLSLSGIKVIT